MIVTKGEVKKFRAECRGGADNLSDRAIIEMLMCEKQRNEQIKNGGVYFDYDRQEWVGE